MSQRASILRRQRRIQEKDREKKELFPHPSLQKNQVKVKDCKNSPIIQSSLTDDLIRKVQKVDKGNVVCEREPSSVYQG